MFGAGGGFHSIHIHGHVFQIVFKDGHELPAPINADTVLVGPGQPYDIVIRCDNPGRWLLHDHIAHHTLNGNTTHDDVMTVIEYEGIPPDPAYYHWVHQEFVSDVHSSETLKQPQ